MAFLQAHRLDVGHDDVDGLNGHIEAGPSQVWSLTRFYSVDFSKSKIGVKSAFSTNAQSRFLSVVVDGVLGRKSPSRALDSPRVLLPELQRYKDTVSSAPPGAEVPGHRQQQLTQTLIVRLLKTHFFTSVLDFEKSTE